MLDIFKQKPAENILMILFIVYLVGPFRNIPDNVATAIDSTLGKCVVVLISLALFAYSNPMLGVIGLLVAYTLIKRSSVKTGMAGLDEFYPTEAKKWSPFTSTNQFPYTLEQEMVKKMTTQKFNSDYVKAPFRPTLDDTHGASFLNDLS